MEKPREIFTADEEVTVVVAGEERTLVSPRFDDEETLVARPVVPLDVAGASAPETPKAPAAHARTRPRRLPSRPAILALILVSVLIGGVLGGAGLYLYQRQSGDTPEQTDAAPAAAPSQPAAPNETLNEVAQPAPTAEASSTTSEAPPADASANAPPVEESKAPADEGGAGPDDRRAAPEPKPESVPAAGTPKRGKKGERDEEVERSARRVDTIFYRPRRATRDRARRQADGDAERLRRIFEGSPQ